MRLWLRFHLWRRPRLFQAETISIVITGPKQHFCFLYGLQTSVFCIAFSRRSCKHSSCQRRNHCGKCGVSDNMGRVCRKRAAPKNERTLGANRWYISIGNSVEGMESAVSSQLIQFICKFLCSSELNRHKHQLPTRWCFNTKIMPVSVLFYNKNLMVFAGTLSKCVKTLNGDAPLT